MKFATALVLTAVSVAVSAAPIDLDAKRDNDLAMRIGLSWEKREVEAKREPDNDLAMRIGLSWEKREEEAKRVSYCISHLELQS